jgi:hypothetical protein
MFWQLPLLSIIPCLTFPLIYLSYISQLNFKRIEINSLLKGDALKNYIKAYGPLKEGELFNHYFSKRSYILPLVLNFTSIFFIIWLYLTIKNDTAMWNLFPIKIVNNVSDSALAGFAGAYLWGHYEIFRRYSLGDLNPMVFYSIWVGFLLSGVLGHIIGLSLVTPLNIITAFGLGAIPLKRLFQYVADKATKQLNIVSSAEENEKPNLHYLQGMNQKIMDRLQEENILTVQNLSLINPVKLLMKTNIDWPVILDLIDQAILFNYLGEKILQVRELGIRCAMELSNIRDMEFCVTIGGDIISQKLVTVIAAKINWDESLLLNVINNLDNDQQLEFIWKLWEEDFNTRESSLEKNTMVNPV